MAAHSYSWTYERDDLRVVIGLSHSYPIRHELRTCYRHLGFGPVESSDRRHDEGVAHPNGRYYVTDFIRPPVDHLLLFFDLSNGSGLTFEPEPAVPFVERFKTRRRRTD